MGVTKDRRVELLAPAGNMEKLEIALHYGADAVYLAGKAFSLRNFADNFTLDEMRTAIGMAHAAQVKLYVAVNIFARNQDLPAIEAYLRQLTALSPDAVIAADPAVVRLVRRIAPSIPIHLSTQANTTNAAAAQFWYEQGVQRINVARELHLTEIGEIAQACPVEIEAFVHGAMCISYSGRCLLSSFMAHRSGNQGECCQPCRFQYAVVEETRPGQYFPVGEDGRGTYLFNSKDLCMLAHLPAMIRSGVGSLKIEGRMKSIHYTATAVKVYREAIDHYYEAPEQFAPAAHWQQELDKITSRGYCTGFYLDDPDETLPQYQSPTAAPNPLAAKVLFAAGANKAHVEVRNQIRSGDGVEIVHPKGPPIPDRIQKIVDLNGVAVGLAQPGSRVTLHLSNDCSRLDLLRHCAV
ncbi:MAG: U32 family peptidase [Desulfatitalea sp.]